MQACSDAVDAVGGQFFSYGTKAQAGKCWKENTVSASCPEGWLRDTRGYDFYSITEARGHYVAVARNLRLDEIHGALRLPPRLLILLVSR